jgi:Ceramidase
MAERTMPMTVQYCEQLAAVAGFEPWNSVSNIAFIVAGVAAWRRTQTLPLKRDVGVQGLMVLALLIGGGSFAWHATHQGWAELADVIPILCFVLLFLFLAIRRLLGRGPLTAFLASTGIFAAIVLVIVFARTALNGSGAYLPVWIGLATLALLTSGAIRTRLFFASACFTGSLTARTLDLAICEHFILGTHWLWHLLNGAVIYLCLMTLIEAERQ